MGDTGVGKTALIHTYFNESFDGKGHTSTLGCDYKIRNIKLKWDEPSKKIDEGLEDSSANKSLPTLLAA